MALPPVLSTEARQAALAKAGLARTARAELKARLKMGSVSLAEVLDPDQTDEVVSNTKVLTILESLPGLGKVKARRVLDEIGIAETRRVKGIGDNQRIKLLELVKA
jgi:DNA uptake protein ComE-like DNA-binding protein